MAYTPGFVHDVFISYATADDRATDGLINYIDGKLRIKLEARLSKRCKVYLDSNEGIAAGAPIQDQIIAHARRSAIFVIVYSEAYQRSDYCKRELHEYSSCDGNAICVLHLASTSNSQQDHSPLINSRRAHELFETTHGGNEQRNFRHDAKPQIQRNRDNRTLDEALDSLANEMAEHLKTVRENSKLPRIHLAWALDEFTPQAEQIANKLEAEGFITTSSPSVSIITPAAQNSAALCLKSCCLYLELVGAPDALREEHVAALSTLQSQAASAKMLTWVNRTNASTPVEKFLPGKRRVFVGTDSELYDEAVHWLKNAADLEGQPAYPAPNAGDSPRSLLIIASSEQADGPFVDCVCAEVDAHYREAFNVGNDAFFWAAECCGSDCPRDTPPPPEWIQRLDNRIKRNRSTGIIFIHGETPGLVQGQLLRDFFYAFEDGLFKTLRARPGICEFPPVPKPRRYYRPAPSSVIEFGADNLAPLRHIATA
ncbi:toll/interleukin-1 receptor domain-containing protein [Verrucomicrobium sp. BvORR106]|uniref:toll/interleukin-1 receptor domain-containing protein n=1 Tax=Verrucomicrobium sp. BvORR106 TaxID=1403819 RepID=UPI000570E44A|nr:toll/interleukin-1 receptor domain-containing protein [Verrucomicrobium sp. BvORR106]